MFKRLAIIALLLITSSAHALEISGRNLTDAQEAELKAQAAKMAAENLAGKNDAVSNIIKDPSKTMALAATWGTQASIAAKGFAEALGIAARELNVNSNEFLDTPAGKLTAGVIIWKVAGESLLRIVFGVCFAIVAFTIARVIYLRIFTLEMQMQEKVWFGGVLKTTRAVRIMKPIKDLNDSGEWLAFWIMLATSIGGLVISGGIMLR